MRSAAALLLLLAAACSPRERYDAPRDGLDRALRYTEQTRRQGDRIVSGADDVERIPKPGLVDIDSRLAIAVRKEKILSGEAAGDPALVRASRELELRERELLKAAADLAGLVDVHRRMLEAYAAAEAAPTPAAVDAFVAQRRALGIAEQKFIAAVRALFPAGSDESRAINKLLFENADQGLQAVRPFFQLELKKVDARQEALAAEVRSRRLSLRLEAFLTSPDRDPEAVHLEHYDDLNQGKVQRRDPFGLDLGPRELERLRELMAASRELADRLEAVRKGEKSLQDALGDAAHALNLRFAELAGEIRRLYADAKAAKEGVDTLQKDLAAFAAAAKAILQEAAMTGLQKGVDALGGAFGRLAPLLGRILELRDLRQKRGNEALPELLAALPALGAELRKLADDFRAEGGWKNLFQEIEKAVEAAAEAAGAEAAPKLRKAWQDSPARAKAEALAALARRAMEAAEPLQRAAGLGSAPALPDGVHVTSAFQVPVDQLKDTAIELERTSRLVGDLVQIRATLYRGQEEVDRHTASFEIREFGWHADLAPSVVLARPYRMESTGDEDFNFAPSLSWLWRYTPRPEQSDAYFPLRFLDPSIGPHATFLNFDSDKEVEIGLGGTLGLWGDRVLGGAGYNLMADASDEGGWYFFVGSSLISLLQDLGVAK